MKLKILAMSVALVLAGCSSVKRGEGEIEPIRNQKLSTSFHQDTIKIETDCTWYKPWKSDCEVVSITSSGTATTNGNSSNNRTTALTRAQMQALANVAHFMNEEVNSNRVSNTIAKNIEKANDRIKSRTTTGEAVNMSDAEAEKDTNYSIRENSNDTAHSLTANIRNNAQSRLRGFYRVKQQEVTGNQEVTVTMRWDKNSDNTAKQLNKIFNNK
jgi:hypothetical protein